MKVVEPESGATSSLQIELTVNLPPYCIDVLAFTNPTVAYTFQIGEPQTTINLDEAFAASYIYEPCSFTFTYALNMQNGTT